MARIRERELHRRLRGLLDDGASRPDLPTESLLAQLERERRRHDEERARMVRRIALLETVVESLPLGVQLRGLGGSELLRNTPFPDPATAPGVLVRHSIERLAAEVLRQSPSTQSEVIEVHGPPHQSLEIVVRSLGRPTESLHDGTSSGTEEPASGGVLAMVSDVTEKRRIDAMRRDFITNVGHELRTPVGAMAILAETLVDETDPETAKRLIARLDRETQRLAVMIDDLLSLARVEAEGGQHFEALRVGTLVDIVLERAEAAAETGQVSLERGLMPDDALVWGDRRELVSALSNLVENAIKYSPEGSVVHLTGEQRLAETGRPMIDLRVVDHGVGIPARDRERIFERFYRVDRARARDTGGTGIGLAIVRHVAMNHGGEIQVDSLEGMGSTFTLSLPEHRPSATGLDGPSV